jgi:hypothetical protein
MFSLFDYPVLVGGTVSGLAYVVIHFFAKDMLAGLRWLWNEIAGFVIIVALIAGFILLCRYVSQFSWAPTAFKTLAAISFVVTALAIMLVNGANRGRK